MSPAADGEKSSNRYQAIGEEADEDHGFLLTGFVADGTGLLL